MTLCLDGMMAAMQGGVGFGTGAEPMWLSGHVEGDSQTVGALETV